MVPALQLHTAIIQYYFLAQLKVNPPPDYTEQPLSNRVPIQVKLNARFASVNINYSASAIQIRPFPFSKQFMLAGGGRGTGTAIQGQKVASRVMRDDKLTCL